MIKEDVFSSQKIATAFGKRHDHILRDIRKLQDYDNTLKKLFTLTSYKDKYGREQPKYLMNKAGFLLLTSTLRGKRVLDIKINILKETNMIPPPLPIRRESSFVKELAKALKPLNINFVIQHQVLNYKIDIYLPEFNLAIEYDENHHNFSKREDLNRESKIKEEINCTFLRLSEEYENSYNIGLVFKNIMKIKGVELKYDI